MKIIRISVEVIENKGCNNGNYLEYTVEFDNGEIAHGLTCRCRCGCSGTDRISDLYVGMEFESIDEYFDSFEK